MVLVVDLLGLIFNDLLLQGIARGVLRGCGRQTIGAVTNLSGYWLLALPLGSLLAFKAKLGIEGMFCGLMSCCWLWHVMLAYIYCMLFVCVHPIFIPYYFLGCVMHRAMDWIVWGFVPY